MRKLVEERNLIIHKKNLEIEQHERQTHVFDLVRNELIRYKTAVNEAYDSGLLINARMCVCVLCMCVSVWFVLCVCACV